MTPEFSQEHYGSLWESVGVYGGLCMVYLWVFMGVYRFLGVYECLYMCDYEYMSVYGCFRVLWVSMLGVYRYLWVSTGASRYFLIT